MNAAEQLIAALETARRLGWRVTIESGRGVVEVQAKRTAIPPGTRATEYDHHGITIARPHLRDALGTLLTILTLEAAGGEAELGIYDGRRDLRTGVAQ